MNLDRVQLNLKAVFADDRRWTHQGRRLVFWYDEAGEFAEEIQQLELPGVKVAVLGDTPFALKRQLVIENPLSPYLLYAAHPKPEDSQNWLLDLQLTGVLFSADRATMIAADLGLSDRSLEQLIRAYPKFFNSTKRIEELLALKLPKETSERELLAGILAVTVKEKTPEHRAILRKVLLGGLDGEHAAWQDIQKFGLAEAFWDLAQASTGFRVEAPTLRRLFIALLLAHLAYQLEGDIPPQFAEQLPRILTPGYSFIADWMRDSRDQARLHELITEVEDDLNIAAWAQTLELTAIQTADTFPVLEKVALRQMVRALSDGGRPAEIAELARERLTYHYAAPHQSEYQAVIAAAEFLRKQELFAGPFPSSPDLLLEQYVTDWYQFDRLYREYVTAADQASKDLLEPLTERIEHQYVQWFQSGLGQAWTDAFDPALPTRLDVQRRQWSFYRWHVEPLLQKNDRDRVVVIISDALRYEVASELREGLLTELRGEANLGSMLSVLPSQTRWGMAALLPGEELIWDAGGERVLRSGQPTQHGNREAHLAQTGYPSLVMKLDELLAMTTENARAALDGKRLVYLYHDAIDALGDKLASENDVFRGCGQALTELNRAVRRLVNNLNSSTVIVTADHGFLYQRQSITEPDKLEVPVKGAGIDVDRRAILGVDLPVTDATLRVDLPTYQPVTGPLQGLFPRSTLRYRTAGGGAQYVHGGASLQEMVVPVLTYRHKRSTPGGAQASRKVKVELVSRSRKVTNNVFSVMLVQADAVSERVRPRTVTVTMLDSAGQPVTDQKRVTLESASPHPTERQQTVRLSVTIPNPDELASYFLTVMDEEDKLELLREPWGIRIAFKDDFGLL